MYCMFSPSGEIVPGNPNTDCKNCFSILSSEAKAFLTKKVSVIVIICPFRKCSFVNILGFLIYFLISMPHLNGISSSGIS